MQKKFGSNLAQLTLVTIFVYFAVIILEFAILPVIINYAGAYAIPAIAASGADQATKDLDTSLINLIPTAVIALTIISMIITATQHREGFQ